MRRQTLFGVGVTFLSALGACNNYDTSPGSKVGQTKGGAGGSGGEAGTLSLGFGAAGSGGGGSGGMAGNVASGGTQAGASTGGVTNHAGTSGSGGSGGSAPAGTCKRVPASDADCTDFEETPSQAYACDDTSAYLTLNGMHASKCANVQGVVAGAKVGACCPP